MLTVFKFLHLQEICLLRKYSSALSVYHCILAENKKLKKKIKVLD